MAIRTVVTRGFGNGTFNGTIKDVVTRGYTIGEAATVVIGGKRTSAPYLFYWRWDLYAQKRFKA